MKRILLMPALLLALTAGGCATLERAGEIAAVITTNVANPVKETNIYQAKNVYAATLQLAVEYRNYCWSKPYADLMADPVAKPVCERRRAVVRKIQEVRPKVATAIRRAEVFVRDNPTLNAATVLGEVWAALNEFKAAVPSVR
jgi:hypothetical protein